MAFRLPRARPRLRGFESPREGAPIWARDAIAAVRARLAGAPFGGQAPAPRPRLGWRGLAVELAAVIGALGFLTASARGGMGMILIGMLATGLALALAAARVAEYQRVAVAHPAGEQRPAFALTREGIALEQDGRMIAVPWSDVLEIVALPPFGLGRHGAVVAFVVSPHRRTLPWVEVFPTRFGLSVWELLPEAERLHGAARREAAGGAMRQAPYRSSGREELGVRARDLAENVGALASALVRSQPLPGCFRVPGGVGRGALLLTPSALCYLTGSSRGPAPPIRRVAWTDVAELAAEGGELRIHMHEPEDDVTLRGLGYPALLIAAVAAAYLRGAVPLSRV